LTQLRLENISKSYNDHVALKDVSLHVPKGSIFGLLGPNGAGKTSLIRIITQIIRQDTGNVYINEELVSAEKIRKIGYLPEERGLYKKMKVGEQLLYFARLRGMETNDATTKIKAWLQRLNLSAWQNKNVEDLSKGMAQKVQFIATVLHAPELIILDEPFSGFDPINVDLIKNEILTLRENGTTVMLSTHRMESVEELCDHIALISKSKKILDGKKTDVKKAYKNGVFVVSHEGILSNSAAFDLLDSHPSDFGILSTISDKTNGNSNELIQALIDQTTIHSFTEKIPSIHEIFISEINKNNG
jgi:ABC-2 type transport system ATP-binding protein